MATQIWVNIGSGNGLLPDGTKPLPEPNICLSSKVFCGINRGAVSEEVLMNLIRNIGSKITLVELLPYLPGANELNSHLHE